MVEFVNPWKKKKEPSRFINPWETPDAPRFGFSLTREREGVASQLEKEPETGEPKSWQDFTAGEAMWYASKLGLLDTYRGGKQILNIDEEEMAEDQKILNQLMQHPEYGGKVTAAYFGGMIVDPAGWFIPATKARTVAKMAKHGLMWGAGAGAAGYVDPEMESLTGEGQLGRGEQALMGAAGGAVISPFMGKMIQLGKKGYAPVGEKVWKAISKNPEVGTGMAGGIIGYNMGEDTTVQEDLKNGLLGALSGATVGLGVRGINKGTGGALGRFVIPDYGLSPEYLMKKGISKRDSNIITRQFNDIVKKFQSENEETREIIYKVLIGEFEGTPDPRLAGIAQEARDVMTRYGRELVDLGVLHKQTFEKNRATYMHRIFKNPNYKLEKSKFGFIYGGDEIRSIGDELRLRGKPETMTGDQWEIERDFIFKQGISAGREGPDYDVIGVVQKGGNKLTHLDEEMLTKLKNNELHSGNIESITVRRDWTPEERLEMGEVTDAAIALNRTGQLMANDVSAHRFFKTISDEYAVTPGVVRTEEGIRHVVDVPEGFHHKAVPNNRAKYGELAGKYLPENIYHDIITMDKWRSGSMFKNPIMKSYRGLNSWWKLTKTAYNAPVHTNNFSSNIVMYDLNEGSVKGLRQAFKDLLFPTTRGESDRLRLARENDVFGGNYIGNEVLRKNKDLYNAYGNALGTGSRSIDSVFNMVPDTILKVGKQAKRFTTDKAQELYTWEDNLFRFGLFNTLVDKGVDPVLAAKQAREGFVDYARSAPMLEVLRHSALPFASYAYGIVPKLAEAGAKRPWKFAKWAAIIAGVNAIGEDLTNDPEKVARERLLMGSDQDRRLFELPMAPTTMLKLPPQLSPAGPEGTDDSKYLNIARSIPGQAFQFTNQGYRIPGLPDVMQPTFGAAGSAIMSGLGINLFTGETVPAGKERWQELGRAFTPNLPIPGIGTYAGTKMQRGMVPGGFVSETKENQTLLTATLQNLGIRIQSIDADKLYGQEYYRFRGQYDAISKRFRKLERDFEEGMYAGKEGKYRSRQKQMYEDLRKLEEKMMKKGI